MSTTKLPCKDCASGHLHTGTPTGHVTTLHSLPCYVSDPPGGEASATGVIVILPDAFGWELVNTRLLADGYAKEGGWRVLVPEVMDGHWLAHDMLETLDTITNAQTSLFYKVLPTLRALTLFPPFIYFNRASITSPRIHTFLRSLRSTTPLPIGVAGFCWGGKHVVSLCSGLEKTTDGTRPLVDCGFTAHPSMLSVPADLEAVTLPLSIANGTRDIQLTPQLMEVVEKVFEAKRREEGLECELVVYEGAKHGFAVRGNPEDEGEMKMGGEARAQAVRWFGRFFGGDGGKEGGGGEWVSE